MLSESLFALLPSKLEELSALYAARANGELPDLAAIEARIDRPLQNSSGKMDMVGSTAIIPVEGVLMPHGDILQRVSGATSPQQIGAQFSQAMSDPAVSDVVLHVNSPGGAVQGIQQLSDQIYAARGTKKVTAVIDGTGASGAYWLASAADRVYIADDTSSAGSIGVYASHVDRSQANAQRGVKVTEIAAGKYKTAGSPNRPLDDVGTAELQRGVDNAYRTFVGAVARNRGVSVDQALGMAEGRIFQGQEAVSVGLVDGIMTLDALLARGVQGSGVQGPAARAALPTAATLAKTSVSRAAAINPHELAAKARRYIAQQAELGRRVSAVEAVQHIQRIGG